jgi:hypothetical protein
LFCNHFWHAAHERLGVSPTKHMPKLNILLPAGLPPEWDACAATAMPSLPRSRKPSSKA